MKLLTRGRDAAAATPPAESDPIEWTGQSAIATKAITMVALACIAAGPIALLMSGAQWLTAQPPATVQATSRDSAADSEVASVESFAQEFVVAWLTSVAGQEKELAKFVPSAAAVTLPKTAWLVWDATSSGVVKSEDGWSVTVAATVAESESAAPLRRWFQVPVLYDDGAVVAQAFPAPVSGPPQAVPPRLAYRHSLQLDAAPSVAVADFLQGLLVTGDVTRFISPSAEIRALTPPPYTAVEIQSVTSTEDPDDPAASVAPVDGADRHVLVTASLIPSTKDASLTAQYALTLASRDGRWEVAELSAQPIPSPPDQAIPQLSSSASEPVTEPTP